MFEQYDCVMAKKDLSNKIKKGCKGVIVEVYTNPNGLEIEFFDKDIMNHIDYLSVEEDDIEFDLKRQKAWLKNKGK